MNHDQAKPISINTRILEPRQPNNSRFFTSHTQALIALTRSAGRSQYQGHHKLNLPSRIPYVKRRHRSGYYTHGTFFNTRVPEVTQARVSPVTGCLILL